MLDTVIIGAGPYGLSMAAHFKNHGIPFRIFGRPMDSWVAHMPKGMHLKSDGFASNIYDPNAELTLERFCAERQIQYAHTGIPVRLDTFSAYGMAFRERIVPELEEKMVVSVERSSQGFLVRLEDGETISARRVVLAVGITHFEYVPENLAQLPSEFLTHSYRHRELDGFKGHRVLVIGGGSSATDLAGLLHEAGAKREPHDRSEAVGRRYSHEIQTRYGRFEVGREHGCTLDRIDLRTNLGTKESQAIQIYPVTRRGDDMLGLEFALRTSLVAHLKMHPAVLDMSLFGRAAQA